MIENHSKNYLLKMDDYLRIKNLKAFVVLYELKKNVLDEFKIVNVFLKYIRLKKSCVQRLTAFRRCDISIPSAWIVCRLKLIRRN